MPLRSWARLGDTMTAYRYESIYREKKALESEQARVQARLYGLIDEARVLEVRLMTALYYFGLAGLPEDERARTIRESDRARYARHWTAFLVLVDSYLVILSNLFAEGVRYAPEPCDLVYLIAIYSESEELDNWREAL